MVGESNQNVFLIQLDASSFAEFELSEFEISRVDCIWFNEVDTVLRKRKHLSAVKGLIVSQSVLCSFVENSSMLYLTKLCILRETPDLIGKYRLPSGKHRIPSRKN